MKALDIFQRQVASSLKGYNMRLSTMTAAAIGLVFCAAVLASAKTEPPRLGAKATYLGDASVEVQCKSVDQCKLEIRVGKEVHTLDNAMLGNDVYILPNHVALFRDPGISDEYSLQFEIACTTYAERPPFYSCLASVLMNNGEVIRFVRYKRFVRDEPWPAKDGGGF